MKTKTTTVSIYLPVALKKKLKELAKREGRTLANFLCRLAQLELAKKQP